MGAEGGSITRDFVTDTGLSMCAGIGGAANKMLLHEGIGTSYGVEVNGKKADCDVCVGDLAGVKVLHAGATAKLGTAAAGASVTPIQAESISKLSVAEADANAAIIEGVVEAGAKAVLGEAQARAGAGVKDLGASAGVAAKTVKVEAGLSNVPFAQVSVSGPEAKAETGLSWKYAGISAEARAGEARAGPFAVGTGVKFGAGFRNGVPEVDLRVGPVTAPCSII